MATKIGEFFIDLAVDAASGNLSVKQLVGALGELDVASVTSVGIISKVGDVLWGLAKAATGTAVEMAALRDITGVDTKLAQQWEKAAQRIDVSAGSVTRSIRAVNDMMGAIAARKQGPPMELTGWLGITPQKGVDAQGRPMMKSFFDLMGEIAQPGNKYWGYTDQVKQQLLGGAFPGADSKDIFRILNEMKAGKFRPQDISVLEGKQVSELTEVRRKETQIGQQMVGIFDKLLVGGGALATVLQSISDKLTVLDRWLGSKEANQGLGILGREVAGVVKSGGNPLGIARAIFDANKEFAGMLYTAVGAGGVGFKQPFGTPLMPAGAGHVQDVQGKLDINITGMGGAQLGRKELFLKRKVTNTDVEHVTINAGNGGLGQ